MSGSNLEVYKDKRGGHRWRCKSPVHGKQVGKATGGSVQENTREQCAHERLEGPGRFTALSPA
jgi:hypothetical protein